MGIIPQDPTEQEVEKLNPGLFDWLTHFSQDPIERLTKLREENKSWPFEEVKNRNGDPVYRYTYASPSRRNYAIVFFASVFITIFGTLFGMTNKVIEVTIYTAVGSFLLLCNNLKSRTLEIEVDGQHYYFYIGSSLIYKGNVCDMYIRLRRQQCTSGVNYFYLVLNAYRVEQFSITRLTENYRELKRHGKRMGYKLNLNYFDPDDISCEHAVRHMISYNTFCEERMASKSMTAMGRRMTDQARSPFGVGHVNNIENDPAVAAIDDVVEQDTVTAGRRESRKQSIIEGQRNSLMNSKRRQSHFDSLF